MEISKIVDLRTCNKEVRNRSRRCSVRAAAVEKIAFWHADCAERSGIIKLIAGQPC